MLIISAAKSLDVNKLKQLVNAPELTPEASVVAPVIVDVGAQHQIPEYFENAFEIYRKANKITDAVKVLIDYMTL